MLREERCVSREIRDLRRRRREARRPNLLVYDVQTAAYAEI